MTEFTLPDLSCGHCASTVTKTVRTLDADAHVEVDLRTRRVSIQSRTDAAVLAAALTDAGYPPQTSTS